MQNKTGTHYAKRLLREKVRKNQQLLLQDCTMNENFVLYKSKKKIVIIIKKINKIYLYNILPRDLLKDYFQNPEIDIQEL